MKAKLIRWSLIVFAIAILSSALYTVDQTEIAVVVQLGNPIDVIDQPGLRLKLPAPIQTIVRFDRRLRVFEARPSEFLTQDKKNIVVEPFACWRIADATRFLQTVKDPVGAKIRLGDMISSEIGGALGTVPLTSLISTDPEALKLAELMAEVGQTLAKKAMDSYGIEVAAVDLRRLNFPEQNKVSVYKRMRSERERIARKYRAEGKEKADTIRAETDKEISRIVSEAYEKAEGIKGEGDAKAAAVYADAYKKDVNFYKMTRTLESYKKFLDEQTTIVLSSDSDLLRLLGKGAGQ
jgi:modulator of FtsH protease HflC